MRLAALARASLGASLVVSLLVACATPVDRSSSFARKTKADAGPQLSGSEDGDLSGGEDTSARPVDPTAACATSTSKAEGAPVYLVFMVDRSGSMRDGGKWGSAVSALKAFFADASGAGLSASLHVFGNDANECSIDAYQRPVVPMTALPAGPTFGDALDRILPNGGTPTLPALQGAHAYARQVQTQNPDGKAVVVLVTDGEPQGCGSSVPTVASAAAAAATVAPTYVIGVGAELDALNAVAQSGGTKAAVLVSTTDPGRVAADFGKAIEDIRQKALACDYKLPAPPNGEQFDLARVNVQFSPSGAATQTLTYNKDCAGGEGWRYDDVANPTRIEICPASCSRAKEDRSAKMDILFGCETKGGVPR